MRHLLVGLVAAAVAVLLPAWALAGNQEVAEKIAANLRGSGQLHHYKIGVKYDDGTAWLKGRVSNREQMETALRLVFETPGVTRVVNDMTIDAGDQVAQPAAQGPLLTVASSQAVRPSGGTASPLLQPLQQVPRAVYPERLARYLLPGLDRAPSRVQADTGPAPANMSQPAGVADRVATSFAAVPLQPVAANATSREPTLAPPQPQAEFLLQPEVQPLQSDAGPTLASRPLVPRPSRPIPIAYTQPGGVVPMPIGQAAEGPIPQYVAPLGGGVAPVRYDQPHLPNYAWPSYAAYPNYAALTYPKQYSPTAWPYIGPFYPYPQVPLGWRKVTLEWHDGWWQLDFDDGPRRGFFSGLFRPCK